LRIAYSTPTHARRVNFSRDLHEEGAFLRTAEMLAVGVKLVLQVHPPGGDYRPIEVSAHVARQQLDEQERGVGVRFDFRSDEELDRWRAFVARLESDYLDGKLPDDALL
jgi:hypothetical protein